MPCAVFSSEHLASLVPCAVVCPPHSCVQALIEADKEKYKDRGNMRFFQVDVASQPVPPGEYDAVLCRDMIQHLPLPAGVEAYRTLEKSGAK